MHLIHIHIYMHENLKKYMYNILIQIHVRVCMYVSEVVDLIVYLPCL